MRVLLLGNGGREHALGWKLAQSNKLDLLVSAPGNPGLIELGPVLQNLDLSNTTAVATAAETYRADLVIVGPEAPLAAGVADEVSNRGIAVCGPVAAAAQLEASKSYAKQIMTQAGVATAAARTFLDPDAAEAHLAKAEGPFVVKADGLAAGKGVLVTDNRETAIRWARFCLEGRIGEAGKKIVVEGYLEGPELSVIALCDGTRAIPFPVARDYKRVSDGDQGPNTGGMGCYSPVDIPNKLVDNVMEEIIKPVLSTLAQEGIPYRGFLYAGIVLTDQGPQVLEFNCRLGDPETQVVLPRLDEDLLDILGAAATGCLPDKPLRITDKAVVNVVLAASGYPDKARTGDAITGIDKALADQHVLVFQAGTAESLNENGLITAGGRVLNVVGTGPDLATARATAYRAADKIDFYGKHYRSDIADAPLTPSP